LEDALKKAVLKFGVPRRLYCDNGAIYSGEHLQRISGELGFHLVHSRPGEPEGRGKIEKFFQYVDRSFKPKPTNSSFQENSPPSKNSTTTSGPGSRSTTRSPMVLKRSPKERFEEDQTPCGGWTP
jgi:transposase InsO family protein